MTFSLQFTSSGRATPPTPEPDAPKPPSDPQPDPPSEPGTPVMLH